MVAGTAFGAGARETPKEITVLTAAPLDGLEMEYAVRRLREDFPDVTVRLSQVDMSDGSALSITAMIAAGNPPNVYHDFIPRVAA
jgi:ABC-type glycerol-3-phosphate transport system substrate-binding protein